MTTTSIRICTGNHKGYFPIKYVCVLHIITTFLLSTFVGYRFITALLLSTLVVYTYYFFLLSVFVVRTFIIIIIIIIIIISSWNICLTLTVRFIVTPAIADLQTVFKVNLSACLFVCVPNYTCIASMFRSFHIPSRELKKMFAPLLWCYFKLYQVFSL
jgi:hypothetical protein